MNKQVNKEYKTWIDENNNLSTWNDWHYNRKKFNQKIKNNTLKLIGTLQPNQNPYQVDDRGVYRKLYNTKVYYINF